MSKVSGFSQTTLKKPKLDEDNSFPSSLTTGKWMKLPQLSTKILHIMILSMNPMISICVSISMITGSSIYKIYQCNPDDPDSEKQVHECFNFVIQEYNRLMYPNSELVDAKIVKANRCCVSLHHRYYITFHAVEKMSGKSATYQTDVIYDPEGLEFSFIRRKGTNKAFLYPLSLVDQNEIDKMEKCAKHAIDVYHLIEPEKPLLEFVKAVRAVQDEMMVPCYRICLKARNTESGQVGTYYAEVIYSWTHDTALVQSFVPEDEMNDDEFLSYMVNELLENQ